LSIPSIDLAAPVIGAALMIEPSTRQTPVYTWAVPEFSAVGWHITSAPPGEPGNTVLNGHNNIKGEVFRDLDDARPGDQVFLETGESRYHYIITNRHIVQEVGASLKTRIANAQWIAPTDDERLTLVTCWPPTGNSHRLIVTAKPVIVTESTLTATPVAAMRFIIPLETVAHPVPRMR
jgi:sortase A